MKRVFVVLLSALLLFPFASSMSDNIDLPQLTFDDLVELRDQLNLAIWNSDEWQEVTVPAGIWVVGKDIPAGCWTIRPYPNTYTSVTYCDRLDEYGQGVATGWRGWVYTLDGRSSESKYFTHEYAQIDADLVEGMYLIARGDIIFTPYAGKQDLGFAK